MATLSRLETLPVAINDVLIEKILNGEPYGVVAQWLLEHHGIKISKSSVCRVFMPVRDKFSILLKYGMPAKEIVKNRLQIEALGVERVAQQILDRLTEKNGPILAYLDEKETSQ